MYTHSAIMRRDISPFSVNNTYAKNINHHDYTHPSSLNSNYVGLDSPERYSNIWDIEIKHGIDIDFYKINTVNILSNISKIIENKYSLKGVLWVEKFYYTLKTAKTVMFKMRIRSEETDDIMSYIIPESLSQIEHDLNDTNVQSLRKINHYEKSFNLLLETKTGDIIHSNYYNELIRLCNPRIINSDSNATLILAADVYTLDGIREEMCRILDELMLNNAMINRYDIKDTLMFINGNNFCTGLEDMFGIKLNQLGTIPELSGNHVTHPSMSPAVSELTNIIFQETVPLKLGLNQNYLTISNAKCMYELAELFNSLALTDIYISYMFNDGDIWKLGEIAPILENRFNLKVPYSNEYGEMLIELIADAVKSALRDYISTKLDTAFIIEIQKTFNDEAFVTCKNIKTGEINLQFHLDMIWLSICGKGIISENVKSNFN